MSIRPRGALFSALALLFLAGCSGSSDDGGVWAEKGASDDRPNVTAGANTTAPEIGPADSGDVKDPGERLTVTGREPAENDALLRYYRADPDTLNLHNSSDSVSSDFQRWVYEPLARRNYKKPEQWDPVLAESWEFDEENLEYTIHLRKGVTWHPIRLPGPYGEGKGKWLKGEKFTARDVTFTFDCILNEHTEAASLRSYYTDPDAKSEDEKYMIDVRAVDEYTVNIKWTKPYFQMDDFTLGIGFMPRHVYSVDKNGEPISFDFRSKEFADGLNDHWANRTMCGTGPLMFVQWDKAKRTTLTRNPDYWGPPVYFSDVIWEFESNPNTALNKGLQNDLDFVEIPEKDLFVQTREKPEVKNGDVVLRDFNRTAYRFIGYNVKREFLKDKRCRWALSHATPVEEIIDKIFHGLATRTTGPFQPGSKAYDDSLPPVEYDLEKARQLLDEAGWTDTNGDGVRDKTIGGERVDAVLDFMIYSDSPTYKTIAEVYKSNCEKIGVNILISPAKWSLMLESLDQKNFDICMLGWVADYKSDPFQIWHGSQAELPESSNAIGYRNPELDAAIEELRRTIDEEKQWELYKKIHRLIYEDQPYTFLFADKATVLVDSRLENVNFYPWLRPFFDFREWHSTRARPLAE